MRGRGVLLALGIVAVVAVALLWLDAPDEGTPLDPRSHQPGGTSALVRLLRELGASVDISVEGPDQGTDVVLMLSDRLDRGARSDLEDWVGDGGVLVVSDPDSSLTPPPADPSEMIDESTGTGSSEPRPGNCDFRPLDDDRLRSIEIPAGTFLYDVAPGDRSCFGNGEAAYVVASELGDGTVVALGGAGIFVNRRLDHHDNAPVAAALLAPQEGTQVTVLDPSVPITGDDGGDRDSLSDLVPDGVWRVFLQLGVAFVLFALWRARRLGQPVDEPQPVKVAGSELVAAVGGLLERSKSPQHAADVLREELRRELVAHLGLAPDTSSEQLAAQVMARTGLDPARVQAALGPGAVDDDVALLAVVRLIDYVRKEVLEHVGT